MANSKNEEIITNILKDISDQIANGTLPWHKPWNSTPPINAISKKRYNGINNVILSTKPYADHRWLTFKQANDLGGRIRKGEHNTTIVYWHFPNRSAKPDNNDTDNDDTPKPTTYEVVWAKYMHVFNVEQCIDLKLPELPDKPDINPIESAQALHVNYLVNGGPKIKHGGDSAYYSPMFDYIRLPALKDFDNPMEYHGTRFHEEIHSTGHSSRLDRKFDANETFGSSDYGFEELIAELGSAMLRAISNIPPNINNSAAYIAGWQKAIKNDPTSLSRAATKAQQAVDFITKLVD